MRPCSISRVRIRCFSIAALPDLQLDILTPHKTTVVALKRTVMWRGGGIGGREGVGGARFVEDVLVTGRSRSVGDEEAERLLPPWRLLLVPILGRDALNGNAVHLMGQCSCL